MASTVRPSVPASLHQSPVMTPSQLSVSAVAMIPTRAATPSSAVTACLPRSRSSVTAEPAATPAIASGRMLAPSTLPRGSVAGAATTSVTGTAAPTGADAVTASCSNWATTGPAADAVSRAGPFGPTTTTPYTDRSSIAVRAAASKP